MRMMGVGGVGALAGLRVGAEAGAVVAIVGVGAEVGIGRGIGRDRGVAALRGVGVGAGLGVKTTGGVQVLRVAMVDEGI